MYKIGDPEAFFWYVGDNVATLAVSTLRDEYGGEVQIVHDDGCYVCLVRRDDQQVAALVQAQTKWPALTPMDPDSCILPGDDTRRTEVRVSRYAALTHIFPKLLQALQLLPALGQGSIHGRHDGPRAAMMI